VALGTDEGADDPEYDGGSVVDAGGGAGACGAAGDVPPGDVDDGDDADAIPHGGGWSSGSSASPSTTDDECTHDARTCSSDSATSQSDEDEGSDGSTPVTDSDGEYESEEVSPAGDSPDEDNGPNVNTVFLESLRVQAPVAVHGEMDYGASLSGRALEWYHSLQDADRAEPVLSGRDDIGDLPRFDTPCLRRVFTYACTANGTLTLALSVVDCVLLHPTPARPRAQSAIPSRLLHTSCSYVRHVRPCRALTST